MTKLKLNINKGGKHNPGSTKGFSLPITTSKPTMPKVKPPKK